jgi:hypothetical protein
MKNPMGVRSLKQNNEFDSLLLPMPVLWLSHTEISREFSFNKMSEIRLKMGTKREDGMIFWNYTSKRKEIWVTAEKFQCLMNKAKELAKIRYSKNPELYKERVKLWQSKNLDKVKTYKRKHENLNSINIYKKKKERIKNNPIFRFKSNIRCLIKNSFSCINHKKSSKTSNILGCSIEDFKVYMESLFQKEMSWENHGTNGWHIDHIIPISSATTEEDVIRLNHYTNLQPLWAAENIRKGNKMP